jgi:hypothetical protein
MRHWSSAPHDATRRAGRTAAVESQRPSSKLDAHGSHCREVFADGRCGGDWKADARAAEDVDELVSAFRSGQSNDCGLALRPGWIICLDDVERLSDKVGFENFLGYVTELRDKWQLKVVLIYNREPIDKDIKSPFHLYEEKVIDRSIAFALDLTDGVDLAFKDARIPMSMFAATCSKGPGR